MSPAWDPRPGKAPDRSRQPWTTPGQVWEAWEIQANRRGKPNTRRNRIMYTRPLYRMFPDYLATQLNEDDMRAFVATMETKCSRLQNGDKPACIRRLDMATCPIVLGGDPKTCQQYAPLQIQSTWSYITAVNQMYEWFREQQRLADGFNPMLPVMRDYRQLHLAEFNELANDPNRRDLTPKEVRSLVLRSPANRAVVYFMAAKFFLRIHEALRMSFEPRYCNIEEGWIIIPAGGPGDPHKRKGNHDVCLDLEAKTYLRRYRDGWWSRKVRRNSDGTPVTQRVAITSNGWPYADGSEGNFNSQGLQKDAERIGLMTGDEERGETVTTHAFRAFACTWATDHDCDLLKLNILRGDFVGGAAGRYINYRPGLPGLYDKYGPVLDVL